MGKHIAMQIDSNPYTKHDGLEPAYYVCEVCPGEPTIRKIDWNSHARGKKHAKAKAEVEARERMEKDIASGRVRPPVSAAADLSLEIDGTADDAEVGYGLQHSVDRDSAPGHVSGGRACFRCGEEGHIKSQCPSTGAGGRERGGGGRACFRCGEEGHIKNDCPNAPSQSNDTRDCYNCRQPGHLARDCPEPSKEGRGSGRGGSGCFKCGQKGHFARDCNGDNGYSDFVDSASLGFGIADAANGGGGWNSHDDTQDTAASGWDAADANTNSGWGLDQNDSGNAASISW